MDFCYSRGVGGMGVVEGESRGRDLREHCAVLCLCSFFFFFLFGRMGEEKEG